MITGRIIHGDVLNVIDTHCCSNNIDLVYIDPPFNTGKKMSGSDGNSYSDSMEFDYYLDFMKDVVENIKEKVLSEDGTIFVHLDWRMVHYVKVEVMDKIFGKSHFLNEIIWKYALGGSGNKYFPRKHDSILWYRNGNNYFFNPPKTPCTSSGLKGKMKKLGDVWEYTLSNNNSERVGYPTQKPIWLLDKIIYSTLQPGGTVADFFCGSGTTAVSAVRSMNSFIVSDRKEEAINVTTERVKLCKEYESGKVDIQVTK